MLKLYFTPGTCALASMIALEHAGADYVETARLPRVMDHRRRMAVLPEVKKALVAEAR